MAGNEIQILITAVDNVTKKLQDIEGKIEQSNNNVKKSNEKLENSFQKVQGAMLNLGQIAQGVHNIFETYQNMQRKVENATDRLENATIRLRQAQEDLKNVTRDSARNQLNLEEAVIRNRRAQEELLVYTNRMAEGVTFTGDKLRDYEDAQLDARRAALDLADAQQTVADEAQLLKDKQDAVTIAQNGVERATRNLDKVLGDQRWSYVDMGIQLISVIGNIYAFQTSLTALQSAGTLASTTTAVAGLGTAAGTTAGAIGIGTLGLVGALSALVSLPVLAHAQELSSASEAYNSFAGAVDTAKVKIVDLNERMAETTGFGGTRQTTMTMGTFDPATGQVTGPNENPNPTDSKNTFWGGGIMGWIRGLKEAEKKTQDLQTSYTTMSDSSVNDIGKIIIKLDEIPTDVYTYHHIITVYE